MKKNHFITYLLRIYEYNIDSGGSRAPNGGIPGEKVGVSELETGEGCPNSNTSQDTLFSGLESPETHVPATERFRIRSIPLIKRINSHIRDFRILVVWRHLTRDVTSRLLRCLPAVLHDSFLP